MFKTLGVVDVYSELRRDSSGGVRGLLGGRIGGQSLLGWTIRRVMESLRIDQVVVLMPQSLVAAHSRHVPSYAPIHAVDGDDTIHAFARLTAVYPAQALVRVGIDNPLVDPGFIDRLVQTQERYPTADYLGYRLDDGSPVARSRVAGLAEWFRASALIAAHRAIRSESARSDLTRMVHAHPELFHTRLIPLPMKIDPREFCLTLRTAEDLELADEIAEALGPDKLNWVRMAQWIASHPGNVQRMSGYQVPTALAR